MSSLGNRTFQGTKELQADTIHRLDDMIRAIFSQDASLADLRKTALTKAQADALYGKVAIRQVINQPGTILNVTNATGIAATPQKAILPVVPVLPQPVNSTPLGTLLGYLQTVYIWNGTEWAYYSGIMEDIFAHRPVNLGHGGTGFLFLSTDTKTLYRWTGTAWVVALSNAVTVDTHVNRVATGVVNTAGTAVTWVSGTEFDVSSWTGKTIMIHGSVYTIASMADNHHLTLSATAGTQASVAYEYFQDAAVNFQVGSLFWESDRLQMYIALPGTGSVDTSGTSVTLTSGRSFDPTWAGAAITINGVVYSIASVTNGSALVLTTSAGSQLGVNYSVAPGYWKWEDGPPIPMVQTAITAFVATLIADDAGLFIDVTDYVHILRWNGSALSFQDGDTGGAYIVMGSTSPPPGGSWHPCDGGSYDYLNPNGSVTLFTTPDLNGNVAAIMGGGFSATINPATSPTWDATHHSTDNNTSVLTINQGTGTLTSVPSLTHNHNLSDANAILNPPSVAAGGLAQYFTLSFWFRA